MLQKLNERIQGVVAWLVIILIATTFTLFGVDYYLQTHQTSNAKVIVNDQPLSNQAFEVNYRRARAQEDIAQMTSADEKNLQNQVLEQMIANEVTVQAARRYGFEVSTEQANAAIVKIAQFQEDGHFSSERYQQALNAALFTPESFQNEVRQGMLLNQQRFAFIGSSFALPAEIERFVRLYMQTRDYEYLTIPINDLEKESTISANEVGKYYKEHQKEFISPEQVSVDYVILSTRALRSKIKISEEDINHFYNENQNNYLTPAQWKVAHILFAVPENASLEEKEDIKKKADDAYSQLQKNPDDFSKLLSLSDDKLSLPEQGVLPWIVAGQSEYSTLLSPLTQKGEISTPIETKHGYEIFKLIDYKPVTKRSLAEVKSTIEEQLAADMVQTQYAQALEQLTDLSYQTPDSLTPVAEALGLKIQQSQPFSRLGGSEDDISKNKQLVNAAFSHDVMDLGNNSEPLQLDNDSVVVLRVKDHIATKELPLEKVQEQIKQLLSKKEAENKAKEIGSALLAPIENQKQLDLIASHQLKWISVEKASRDSETNAQINDLAFNLLQPESRDGVALENGDYVVVRLKHIHDGILSELDKEQKDSLIQQIETSYGMMDYDLYVHNLINHAQVERH